MSVKRCYNFGPDQVASIDTLARELGIDKTDVLTNGLRLVRLAVRAQKQGYALGIVSNEYVVSELVGPWNDVKSSAELA